MRQVLAYTAARVAIFVLTAALLKPLMHLEYDDSPTQSYLLLLAVAALVSGVVSYVLLSGQREAMSAAVVEGARKQRRRFEAARTKEDPRPAERAPEDSAGRDPADTDPANTDPATTDRGA